MPMQALRQHAKAGRRRLAAACALCGLLSPLVLAAQAAAAFNVKADTRIHREAAHIGNAIPGARNRVAGGIRKPEPRGAPARRIRPRRTLRLATARPTRASFSAARVSDVETWSLEYARARGAWAWQGEFSGGMLDDGNGRAGILAGYGALHWFVSGHARRHDSASGRFVRVHGGNDHPGRELALRFERIVGRQRDDYGLDHINATSSVWTLASHWFPRANLRLTVDVAVSYDHDHLTHQRSTTRTLGARVRYRF